MRLWLAIAACLFPTLIVRADRVADDLARLNLRRGIVAVVGLPDGCAGHLVQLCKESELTIYAQTQKADLAGQVRKAADQAGLLGRRLFVQLGSSDSVHLGNDVADRILVLDGTLPKDELMRALRPRGFALLKGEKLVKPVPDGVDDWSHPYHGPDNNPNSEDKLVRGDFRTQFLGYPKFSPMPEQTVIAGGRIYKAMGHIAHKANQNEMLNTLLCINAYNGTILWKRPLSPGFMLHRNTMIGTEDALYMGDHESCKIIDGETGQVRDELKVDQEISDGPVWKWMAMRDGVLYALVGNPEVKIETQRAIRRGLGHWPWGMWDGHDYDDPRTSFGFGRTVVAIDLKTKQRIWDYRDKEFLDARAVCMNDTQIFCYCPGKFLASIDRYTGKLQWRNEDKESVGCDRRQRKGAALHHRLRDHLLHEVQRRLPVLSLVRNERKWWWRPRKRWQPGCGPHPTGNLQLVLRDDGIWAAGPQKVRKRNEVRLRVGRGPGDVSRPAAPALARPVALTASFIAPTVVRYASSPVPTPLSISIRCVLLARMACWSPAGICTGGLGCVAASFRCTATSA